MGTVFSQEQPGHASHSDPGVIVTLIRASETHRQRVDGRTVVHWMVSGAAETDGRTINFFATYMCDIASGTFKSFRIELAC